MSDEQIDLDELVTEEETVDGLPIVGYVSVSLPEVTEGDLVEVPGLGAVPNGGFKPVNEAQVQMYKQGGYTWPDDNHLVLPVVVAEEEEPVEDLSQNPPPPVNTGDKQNGDAA
jgi:hypothetical protein